MSKKPKRRRKSRRKDPNALPKGAYRLPNGNIMTAAVVGAPDSRGRSIVIRGVLRAKPDVHRLAMAVLEVAREQQQRKLQATEQTDDQAPES